MWISIPVYQTLVKDRAEAIATAQVLDRANVAQKVTTEWLMARLTQLEHERAQLIQNYMGVKIVVPSFEPAPDVRDTTDFMNQLPNFDDVGDAEARRLGLDWNEQGEMVVTGRK